MSDAIEVRGSAKLKPAGSVEVTVRGFEHGQWLVERAVKAAQGMAAIGPMPEALPTQRRLIGSSAPMQLLFKTLDRIRNTDATVLVLGENGTGKELVAKCIHQESRRSQKAFVAANCSAFNDNLLESEMFGHKRGAFTGATQDKVGLFEAAHLGTFFMDEVGEMSPSLQVKLLRVLQEGTFMPVGGTATKKVDVRIIAATNRELTDMVKKGTFREDLLYRLNVVTVRVPPLRERKDDIPALVAFFLTKLKERYGHDKTITQQALEHLLEHNWPGNVRELENEIERLWVLSGTEPVIDHSQLPTYMTRGRRPLDVPKAEAAKETPGAANVLADLPQGLSLPDAVEFLERKMITEALTKARGNKTKTAQELGISRRNLIRKVQGYAIHVVKEGADESDEIEVDDEDNAHN